MNATQTCACRVLDEKEGRSRRPFVILVSDEDAPKVREIVSVSMEPGSECFGASWRSPSGEMTSVKRFSDPVPAYPDGFDLRVCNGGQALSTEERESVRRWRNASQ